MAIQVYTNGETIYGTSSFSVPSNGPHTLMCWINAAGAWTGTTQSMVGLYSSANIGGGAGVAAQIGGRGTTATVDVWEWGGTVIVSTTGFTPPVGSWFHVAFTYDGTTARIYINGALNNSAAFTKNVGNFNMFFVNGFISGGASETSQFQTDEVMAFNRTLSANEIATIYNTRGARDGIAYGLVGRFTYDELYPGTSVVSCIDDSVYAQQVFPQSNTVVTPVGSTGWTNAAGFTFVTTGTSPAPDGSSTASNISFTTTTNARTFSATITTTATTAYAGTVFIKNNGGTGSVTLQLGNTGGTINAYAIISLATMTVTSSGVTGAVTANSFTLTPVGNGWYVLEVYGTFTAAGTAIGVRILGSTGTGNFFAWNANRHLTSAAATYVASTTSPSDYRTVQI